MNLYAVFGDDVGDILRHQPAVYVLPDHHDRRQAAAAQATPIVAQNIAAQATATAAQTTIAPVSPAEDEEPALDPLVLEFLDADSYEEKLNILAGLHHRITNEMITTMAISCDIEVNDGEPEERYEELKNCLLTMEKFECNRLR